jgi:O-methyltransferase
MNAARINLTPDAVADSSISSLYLDLIKRCLTRDIDDEHFRRIPRNEKTFWRKLRSNGYEVAQRTLAPLGMALVQETPRTGETMIGMGGLNNLQECVEDVLRNKVPGDLVETGVWRGGAVIFMRALLTVHGDMHRSVWAFDSFSGLPKPNKAEYPADAGDALWSHSLDVSLEEVKNNFRKYQMLDDRVHFVKGWFKDTIPRAEVKKIAVLRLDGDMYESTIQVLNGLYDKVSLGGYVIIDDYNMIPQCNEAVHDFRSDRSLTEDLVTLPGCGAYWRREAA